MKNVSLLLFVVLLMLPAIALAKRAPPKEVAALRSGAVEYRVPHEQMGCVEAWDTEHKSLLWRRQIYVVKYFAPLERDVQDVFITSLELVDGKLRIKNERNSHYELNPETLEVTVVSGVLVEGKK